MGSVAYAQALTVESRGWTDFAGWLSAMSDDGQWCPVTFAREGANRQGQKLGDAVAMVDGVSKWFELKVEETDRHGNFFLETWSNRRQFTPGWMYSSQCDWLCYMFLELSTLYVLPFRELRQWAFHEGRIYKFPERRQAKRAQLNDSWGRCVPVTVVGDEVGFKVWQFEGGVWR